MRNRYAIAIVAQLALASGAFAAESNELIKSIIKNGHKRVAVLPAVIVRNGDDESTIGSLGPRARLMADGLYRELVAASQGVHRGKFIVVPERTVQQAMRTVGFRVEHLGDLRAIRKLARAAGADTLVTLTKDVQKDQYLADTLGGKIEPEANAKSERVVEDNIHVESVATETGNSTSSSYRKDQRTISKAAYMGESWELRRWVGGKLQNLAIGLKGNLPFGTGPQWEKYHYISLQKTPHPLMKEDFPFHVGLYVNGKLRKPEMLRDKAGKVYAIVPLRPGEVYQVGVNNKGEKSVYSAIYVDGANSIDKLLREPSALDLGRHWHFPARKQEFIEGWYTIRRNAAGTPLGLSQNYNEFKIAPKEQSVAALGKGFDSIIGQVTVLFYTVGMAGVEVPKDSQLPVAARGLPSDGFGTGLGALGNQQLTFVNAGDRGLLLAAVTLYYRTPEHIAGLKKGIEPDPVVKVAEYDLPGKRGGSKSRSESDLPGSGRGKGKSRGEDTLPGKGKTKGASESKLPKSKG